MTTKPQATISFCRASRTFTRNGKRITIAAACRIWKAHNAHWTSNALDAILARLGK